MTDIYITDLFGVNIDCNPTFHFILLHLNDPLNYLIRLDNQKYIINEKEYVAQNIVNNSITKDNDSIWEINIDKIHNYFMQNKNIKLKDYVPLGHLWYPTIVIVNPITILLGNRKLGLLICPTSYVFIAAYKNGTIWKPINEKRNCKTVSFVFTTGTSVPTKILSYLVNNYALTSYNGSYYYIDNITNSNEFHYLSTIEFPRLTINRTKFSKPKSIKLQSEVNDKYINYDDNKLVLSNDDTQQLKYTVDGQLLINNKCLTIPKDKYKKHVNITECDNSTEQKWYPYNNHYVSQFNKLCLSVNDNNDVDNNIIIDRCTQNDISQFWRTHENITGGNMTGGNNDIIAIDNNNVNNDIVATDNKIDTDIKLVETDNPWYLNHDNNKSPKIIDYNLDNDKNYDYAPFESLYQANENDVQGHSYAARQLKPCNCTKNCTHKNSKLIINEETIKNTIIVDYNVNKKIFINLDTTQQNMTMQPLNILININAIAIEPVIIMLNSNNELKQSLIINVQIDSAILYNKIPIILKTDITQKYDIPFSIGFYNNSIENVLKKTKFLSFLLTVDNKKYTVNNCTFKNNTCVINDNLIETFENNNDDNNGDNNNGDNNNVILCISTLVSLFVVFFLYKKLNRKY